LSSSSARGDNDACALLREAQGNLPAYALRAAGDDSDFVLQLQIHFSFLIDSFIKVFAILH
jgi:hypothetical protein